MYAVLDTETTGLSPRKDRIIELAIIGLDADGNKEWEWCSLVNPERDTGSGLAVRAHQIYPRDVEDAPTFPDFAGLVAEMLSGRALIAHNARFDVGMLGAEYERIGVNLPNLVQICTATVAREHGIWPFRLEACCASLGIEREGAHHALADARATCGLAQRLVDFSAEALRRDIADRLRRISRWPRLPVIGREPVMRPILPARDPTGSAGDDGKRRTKPQADAAVPIIETASVERGQPETRYLGAVEWVVEDREVTPEEEQVLVDLRDELGLSQDQVRNIHMKFLRGLAGAMWEDGEISKHEAFDLQLVGKALGMGPKDIEDAREHPFELGLQNEACLLQPGAKVVFTGEMSVARGEWTARAEATGLKVTKSVSGKTVFLVVPYGETGSSKSRKARELGVRVVSEQRFNRMILALEKGT